MVIRKIKKVKALAVNGFFMLFIYACSNHQYDKLKPTYNLGGYTIEYLVDSAEDNQMFSIQGSVYDFKSKEPITGAIVSAYCDTLITNDNGFYSLVINKPMDIPLMLNSNFIGYKYVETAPIELNRTGIIKLNFYLMQDETLIVDCH